MASFPPARAFVERAFVRVDPEFFVELAGFATTAFFETDTFLFDADFFFAARAFLGAEVFFFVEVFFFEVLFLLDTPAVFAAFLRVVPVAFFAFFFVAFFFGAVFFFDTVFLPERLAAFLRPGAVERLTVFFREDALAVFLLLPDFFFFFLAAAFFAGICLASKRDYTKRAIIHTAGASGSL